jgi:hypothetical protein
MNKDDIYSLMLFTLYKVKDIPDYLTLSELCYVLDGENLTKFLSYFGGMTITIPKPKDLRLVLKGLMLYQYVNVEGGSFDDSLKALAEDEFSSDEIKNIYVKIVEVISNYDFARS